MKQQEFLFYPSLVARWLSCKITTANSVFMDDNRSILCTLLFGKFSSVASIPTPSSRIYAMGQNITFVASFWISAFEIKWQTVVFLLPLLPVTHRHRPVLEKNSNYILLTMKIATIAVWCFLAEEMFANLTLAEPSHLTIRYETIFIT